jgi:hypothetical protein
MKIRYNTTSISALFLSLWLAMMIPGNLKSALTWKERYLAFGCVKIANFVMPMGVANLGIVMIGLIVLWAGYRKNERWAWFVMLIILLCLFLPFSALPEFRPMLAEIYRCRHSLDLLGAFREDWHCLAILSSPSQMFVGAECLAVAFQIELLGFLVALVALLLPIKAFFWKSYNLNVSDEHKEQDGGLPVGDK